MCSAAASTVSSRPPVIASAPLVMPPSRLPEDRRPVASQPGVWPRRVRSAIGAGRRRRAASAGRGPCDPGQRGDQLPGVPGRVGCRNTEGPQQPFLAVGAVVGQGLAGPLAGAQHPPPGVAEVIGVVGLALAARRGPGRAGRSWAGCRSGASSRTAASTAASAAPRPAGRRDRTRGRWRPGGSRRFAWSGTWSGSRCTGRLAGIRRARPGRRTGPRTGPRARAGHRGRWRPGPHPRSGRISPVAGSTYRPAWSSQTGSSSPSRYLTGRSGHQTWW